MADTTSSRPDRIDAHHHLWRYSETEYPWIREEMDAIRRDFLVADLERTLQDAGLDGAVTVQARQTLAETEWLLDLSSAHESIRAVVGWVPLVDPSLRGTLEELSAQPKLRAVRHGLQDEPYESYMLRKDFQAGISLLNHFGLAYDLLIFERHLPQALQLVDSHPNQVFILDHIAKPRIRDGVMSPWKERLRELSERRNVFCKLSGLVTEANSQRWTESDLQPYIEWVLECFGAERTMFGSDWPVCLVATSYNGWLEIVLRATSTLSPSEQRALLGETAKRAYRF